VTGEQPKVRPPFAWTLWHPHQKLWNWRLEAILRRAGRATRLGAAPVRALVAVDSLLLLARVVLGRVARFGPVQAFRTIAPTGRVVLYVDCGVHRDGEQVRFVAEELAPSCELHVLAFEASAEHCEAAARNLADVARDVHLDLRQVALVGPGARDDTVKLFKGSQGGKADSLFRTGDRFEVVPAARLSDILRRDFSSELDDAPLLVRMNIEGSEYDVVEDLVASRLASRVDGWFGMWDDVGKLDPDRDRRFRALLHSSHIRNITFNDRDLRHPLRRRAIRLALDTAVRAGLRARPSPGRRLAA
jgi:FkbM family methyltransferase